MPARPPLSPPGLAPWRAPLRAWQARAFAAWQRHADPDFLAVATPGGGKTTFGLRCAHEALLAGRAARVVVVCPTDHLRRQWAEAAARVGLQLDPAVTGPQREGPDYQGMVVTYQQVCGQAPAYRQQAATTPTFVIFDEIHHAGDGRDWGEALRGAFAPATGRLALSGTPFRSDDAAIPFVRYCQGISQADFRYGYGEALRDRVCRPVYFPTYGGVVSWVTAAGETACASFDEPLPEARRRERLKAAVLSPDWLRTVLRQMHQRLLRLRGTHPQAGGLVIAPSQAQARRIAEWLRALTGSPADVAVSDDPGASATIHRFAASTRPWLVAVNMVSEGVDIPRLRVGVFATTVLTELYFRQVVGRFIRYQAGVPEPQPAYVAVPADPVLVEYAVAMAAERQHVLEERGTASSALGPPGAGGPLRASQFRPVSGEAHVAQWIAPLPAQAADAGAPGEPMEAPPPPDPAAEARFRRRAWLRREHQRLVGRVAARWRRSHREIHLELIRLTGSRIETATIPQLEQRLALLTAWARQPGPATESP